MFIFSQCTVFVFLISHDLMSVKPEMQRYFSKFITLAFNINHPNLFKHTLTQLKFFHRSCNIKEHLASKELPNAVAQR